MSTLIPEPKNHWHLGEVACLGEDGTVLAVYGHVDKRIVFCSMVAAHTALIGIEDTLATFGFDDSDYEYPEHLTPEDVEHVWVIEDPEANHGEGWVSWNPDITEDTPGAKPASLLHLDR